MLFPFECSWLGFAQPAIPYFFGPSYVEFEITDLALKMVSYFDRVFYFFSFYKCVEEGRALAAWMPDYHSCVYLSVNRDTGFSITV
jgi:hypothetical protein